MEDIDKAYLPAAGHDWALPLYDPLVKFLGGDKARKILFDQAVGLSLRRVWPENPTFMSRVISGTESS